MLILSPAWHLGNWLSLLRNISGKVHTNRDGQKVYTTDIVIEEQEFAESKSASEANSGRQRNDGYQGERSSGGYQNSRNQQGRDQTYQQQSFTENKDGFMNIPDGVDDELPFH